MFQIVLIGAGQRGMIYAQYAYESGLSDITAIAEPDEERRTRAGELLHVPLNRQYESAEALFQSGCRGNAAIIATLDRLHYEQTMAALDLGYDILLEKPISQNPVECLRIANKAKALGRRVVVCHVLRYSPFFQEIKQILDSGKPGKLISIQHNENIGNFHMAHSFVRGNWSSAAASSPIITQKSCHDMDLLVWLSQSRCQLISAFGGLSFFNKEHAPQGAAKRCRDCKFKQSCRFSAYVCYPPVLGDWPATVLCAQQTEEALQKAMDEGPYGRCVFACDNDVCDHMSMSLEFENGVTATFNLSAFTNRMARQIKLMCENEEIIADEYENRITITPFAPTGLQKVEERVITPIKTLGAHSGGDIGLMNDFFSLLKHEETQSVSDISRSIESHFIAAAAEESRISHQTVDMNVYRAQLCEEAKR